jgi:hypothetical protein
MGTEDCTRLCHNFSKIKLQYEPTDDGRVAAKTRACCREEILEGKEAREDKNDSHGHMTK